MITPEDHNRFIESTLEGWEDNFADLTARQRKLIVSKLKSLLRQNPFDTFSNGMIRPTGKNIATAKRIFALMQSQIWPKYLISGWSDLEKVIVSLERANQKYFNALDIAYSNKPIYKSLINDATNVVLFTFNRDGRRNLLEAPIRNLLNTYVRQGGNIDNLTDLLEKSLTANSVVSDPLGQPLRQGFLDYRRLKQKTTDALFTLNRSYQSAVADSLGMDWFKYAGGLVRDSRSFCSERAKGYYHRKEIEYWGKHERWEGRIPGTNEVNIFQRLGGYSCRHSLIPVTLVAVPNKWIKRAHDKGFYIK